MQSVKIEHRFQLEFQQKASGITQTAEGTTMQKARSFGGIVLIYAFAAHLFGAISAAGLLAISRMSFENTGDYLFVALSLLPLLLFPLYLAGGAGLLLLRRWAVFAVLLAACADVLSHIISVVSNLLSSGKTTAMGVQPVSTMLALLPLAWGVIPGIIAYFAIKLRGNSEAWMCSADGRSDDHETTLERQENADVARYRYLFRGMIVTGMALPWLVGAGVKLYLSAHGKPTIPWSYFINLGSILIFIPFTIWFSLSYIVLAYLGRMALARPLPGLESVVARVILILGGFVGGLIGTVKTFIDVFWVFDFLFFLAPLWAFNIPYMLVGALAGYVFGLAYERFFRR